MGHQNGTEILASYDQKLFCAKTIILSHIKIIFHDQLMGDVRHCDGRVSVTNGVHLPLAPFHLEVARLHKIYVPGGRRL